MARRLVYGTMTAAAPGEALAEGASFVDVQVWEVPDDRWDPSPNVPRPAMLAAMMEAAAVTEKAPA